MYLKDPYLAGAILIGANLYDLFSLLHDIEIWDSADDTAADLCDVK